MKIWYLRLFESDRTPVPGVAAIANCESSLAPFPAPSPTLLRVGEGAAVD
ncbi:hypothetical protein [Scytonema sp. HK-05]|nr:hypothetical protein [Scytonema sp. HK-05]